MNKIQELINNINELGIENSGVTSVENEHSHEYQVDDHGNGSTLDDNTGHVHKIIELEVRMVNDHIHTIGS